MKYLRKFQNHTEYEQEVENLVLPNVSYCVQENEVHYNPFVDPYNGHAYVEIGGLKWATMNVGATSETDYGLYFQWGDTQGYTASQVGSDSGQKAFRWADYKFNPSGDGSTFTKYNSTDSKTILDLEDDAARANWGGEWRMPTTEELQALSNAVNAVWTTNYNGSGINGILCTDKTDSSKTLFFPAAGHALNGSMYNVGNGCYVWSSSLYSNNHADHAWNLYFFNEATLWDNYNERFLGFAVRGVVGENNP